MKFILVAFLSFFYISHLRADLGGCVVYKAKYVLKNGQTVTGWLPISGYEDYASFDEGKQTNKYCGDLAFQKLINHLYSTVYHTYDLTIFKRLDMLKLGKSANQSENPNPNNCVFTDSNSVVKLHLDSVAFTIFIKAKYAEWDYPQVGIEIFDSQTAQMMRDNDVICHTFFSHEPVPEEQNPTYMHLFDGYFVACFDKSISYLELQRELRQVSIKFYAFELFYVKNIKRTNRKYENLKQEQRAPIFKALQKKGIVFFRVYEIC
jgi:hypothetical protein